MNIPIYDPQPEHELLKEEIDEAIQAVLSHGQFILGPEVKQFEEAAADYLGVKHAIGVNSGTDALVIALRALGIGAGDEVITTSMSFFATAESISMVGAMPVFVDINERTFNLEIDNIESAITPKTKAILPVHLFGRPAEMTQIMALAEADNLKVIEDCAQSFGATYNGNKTGGIGDVGTFSFFPTKNLGGIGDGGLVVTDDDEVVRKANMLRVHGADQKYHNKMLGYNSRLDTIQAAVLLIKLQYIDQFNQKRRAVAQRYDEGLNYINDLVLPRNVDGHVFHQYTVRVQSGQRDALKSYLKKEGIGTKIYFPVPQNELPVYHHQPVLQVSHHTAKQVLSLPMGPHLTPEVQDHIIEKIITFFG